MGASAITLVNGLLKIPSVPLIAIRDFALWFVSQYGISNNTSVSISSIYVSYYLLQNGEKFYISSGSPGSGSSYYFDYVGSVLTPGIVFENGAYMYESNGKYYFRRGAKVNSLSRSSYYLWAGNYSTSGVSFCYHSSGSVYISDLTFGSKYDLSEVYSSSQSFSVDAGSVDIPDYGPNTDVYVNPDIVNPSGTLPGFAEGVIDAAIDNDLTVSVEAVENGDTPVFTYVPVGVPDGYQAPPIIKDVFPFCIPFDVINMVALMVQPAEAPVVTIPWEIPSIGFRQDIVLDMSAWNQWANVFRTCELVIFVVGLALVTRSLYLRG